MKMTSGPMETRMVKFLFHYRLTPHSTTGCSPAELLLHRQPRSLLDVSRPKVGDRVRHSQEKQKVHYDAHASACGFELNDLVLVRNFSHTRPTKVWLPGLVAVRGPLSYLIRLMDTQVLQRHIDYIQLRSPEHHPVPSVTEHDDVYNNFLTSSGPTSAISIALPGQPLRHSGRYQCPLDWWCPS